MLAVIHSRGFLVAAILLASCGSLLGQPTTGTIAPGAFGDNHWKAPVANAAALPMTGNAVADTRCTLDDWTEYRWNGAAWIETGGAGGGVSSVALSVPSWLAVAGSPITTLGTITISGATGQPQHRIVGTCGSATTVGLCAPTAADVPAHVHANTKTLVVDKGGLGQFTTIADAVDFINTQAHDSSNLWLIRVLVGAHDADASFTLPTFTSLVYEGARDADGEYPAFEVKPSNQDYGIRVDASGSGATYSIYGRGAGSGTWAGYFFSAGGNGLRGYSSHGLGVEADVDNDGTGFKATVVAATGLNAIDTGPTTHPLVTLNRLSASGNISGNVLEVTDDLTANTTGVITGDLVNLKAGGGGVGALTERFAIGRDGIIRCAGCVRPSGVAGFTANRGARFDSSGVLVPASGDLSGTNTGDQIVPVNTAATSSNFFTAYNSSTGAFTKARPACADLSDAAATCSSSIATGLSAVLDVAHGGLNLSAATDDTIPVGNGTTWQAKPLPDCADTTGNHLNYAAATNTITCGTSSSGGGGTLPTDSGNKVVATPADGSSGIVAARKLVAADIPSLSASYLPISGGILTGALQSTLSPLYTDIMLRIGEATTGFSNAGGIPRFWVSGIEYLRISGDTIRVVAGGRSMSPALASDDPGDCTTAAFQPYSGEAGTGLTRGATTNSATLCTGGSAGLRTEPIGTTVWNSYRLVPRSTPPFACTSAVEGATYYDTEDHDFCDCKGAGPAWASRSAGSCS